MNKVCAIAKIDNILRRVLRAHAPLLVIASIYVGACVLLTRIYKVETHLIYHSCKWFIAITGLYFQTCGVYFIVCIVVLRPHRPLSYIWNRVRCVSAERRASFVLVVAIVAVHMIAFMYVKPLIPVMHPFEWDAQFARWDTALHGTDPWRVIHPYLFPKSLVRQIPRIPIKSC